MRRSKRVLSEERFLTDVADHKMTVVLNDGVNRCIRFAATKDSWNMHFTLTTWPGYLCISGDMGCFVFTRLDDMFEFFRSSSEKPELYINTGYWAEKCEAEDRRTNGIQVYEEEVFKEIIGERFNEHEFESEEAKKECWEQIESEVLIAENEYEAHSYASQFKYEDFEFSDFWEHNLKTYTYHYLWCCYAIAWGIRQYDLANEPVEAVTA